MNQIYTSISYWDATLNGDVILHWCHSNGNPIVSLYILLLNANAILLGCLSNADVILGVSLYSGDVILLGRQYIMSFY